MCALSRLSAVAFGVGPATASRAEQWCAVARGLQAGVEGPFPPLQLTMLWNLCVDMTSSGAPVLDRLRYDCRLDPSWATVTRCEWGSSVFTVVYTEGAMAIIIRVALPSSFRAASYHGGSSQLLILLVSAVRGAVPLRRRRSGAVSYLQLLHAAPPLGELIGSNLLARFSRCLS